MATIVIERTEGSLVDRFRPYKVMIDGQPRGAVNSKESKSYDVGSGVHSVVLRSNFWGSPPIKVAVLSQTRLVCRSTFAHAFGLMALLAPGSWIQVREEDTSPAPADVANGRPTILVEELAA